ncbi:hypothetical protein, partial [Kitasatospora sp. MBT63]
MAICTSCGAGSADGAQRCAACDRPFGAPAVSAISEVTEVGGSGAYAGLAADPGFTAAPPPGGPPPLGHWGRGVPYDPRAGRPELLRRLVSADWLPALRAVAPPTAVLLLVPLLIALPGHWIRGGFPFGNRFGAALGLTMAGFGAPLTLAGRSGGATYISDLRLLPMTVTVLWAAALWLGLRPARRFWRARGGGVLTARTALLESARVAALAGLAALLLGLAAGTRTGAPPQRYLDDLIGDDARGVGLALTADQTMTVGWLQSTAWTVLAAGLIALLVYGADALNRAAATTPVLRGWPAAARIAGRTAALSTALASAAATVVVLAWDGLPSDPVWLLLIPNGGLALLGFGSGATLHAVATAGYEGMGEFEPFRISLFDLHGATGNWRWALLLALVPVCLLGWTAHRHRLGLLDRIRLAVVYAVLVSVPMLLAGLTTGFRVESARPAAGGPSLSPEGLAMRVGSESTLALVVLTVLVANLLWAAFGALALPPLLTAARGRPAGPADQPQQPWEPQAAQPGAQPGAPQEVADAPLLVVVPAQPDRPPVVPPSYAPEVLD